MSDGKSALKVLGIGCAVVLVLGAGAVGSCVLCIYNTTKHAADAGHAFLLDLRSGNAAGALARTTLEYQTQHPLPNFLGLLAANPVLTGHSDATFSSRNVNAVGADMSGTLETPMGPVPVALHLVTAPDGWRVASITVNGINLP